MLEVAPAHGKLHMVAPHTAHPDVDMLRHSELGYHLLPGNHYAASNLRNNLEARGAPIERSMALAMEQLALEPLSPSGYEALVRILEGAHCYREAIVVAKRVRDLYARMPARTWRCLQQSPEAVRYLKNGWDPFQDMRQWIEELEDKAWEQPPGPLRMPPGWREQFG